MTPKGHRVHSEVAVTYFHDPKGHGDLMLVSLHSIVL